MSGAAASPRVTPALPVFRFAPSPNGRLHLGHAYSALLNDRAARANGGRFLLRIEDIDLTRVRSEFEAGIHQDLTWLGLEWELPVLRQSTRSAAYREALAELTRTGLLYPAFLSRTEIRAAVSEAETRGEIWPRDLDGAPLYPGPERFWTDAQRRREQASGRPYALRLDMGRALEGLPALDWRERDPLRDAPDTIVAADPAAWGDVVLARIEAPASYHLAVVVDDAHQGVTHVVRGRDLWAATGVHRLLQTLLGLAEPLYFHHRLVLDGAGEKLSKSRGSKSLQQLRAEGASAGEVRAMLGFEGAIPESGSCILEKTVGNRGG